MAKGTPKKKPLAKSANSLLNFFQKADDPTRTGQEDVKPDVRATTERTEKVKSRRRGSERDPVIISDDELTTGSSTVAKRRKVLQQSSVARASPFDIKNEALLDLSDGHESFPVAGPSRSPSIGDPSRSPVPTASVRYPMLSASKSPKRSTWSSPPPSLQHPFPAQPDYVCPPTWPQIVNTAPQPDDYDDPELEGSSDSDTDKARGQDPIGAHGPAVNVNSGLDLESDDLIEEVPIAEPPVKPSGIGDPGLEWDEGDDEGMGMEEDEEGAEEEAGEIVEAPTHKLPKKAVGKVHECPMCGKSLKGQVNSVRGHHLRPAHAKLYSDHAAAYQYLLRLLAFCATI